MESPQLNTHVLMIDDEPGVLAAFRSLFRGEHVTVHTLEDPTRLEEALEKDGPFAVILTDHKMPGRDGMSVLMAVARLHPATVRVLVTGRADMNDVQRAVNFGGITSFVRKPWDEEELRALVIDGVSRYNLAMEKERVLRDAITAVEVFKRPPTRGLSGDCVECTPVWDVVDALERERGVLLKEIHHRVKNNLQVISSLLRMQSANMSDERSRGMMEQSIRRIKSMALVHDRLYQATNAGEIDLVEYARTLAQDLARTLGRPDVSWTVQGPPISLGVDMAVPLGLILNDLLGNAFHHAFEPATTGTITVDIARLEGGLLEIRVRDDGRGLPAGFDVNQASSLGLTLVAALCAQLDGSVESIPGRGTELVVRVPLNS